MQQPACSVVIPARDCLAYLPAALGSVALQNRQDIEVIVADDGSTDGTQDWLAGRRAVAPPLRVIETGGVGPAEARNAAIAASRAPYIAFLDADDMWWPDKLTPQLAWHESHPETAFSFTDYLHVSPAGRQLGTCFAFWNSPLAHHAGRDFHFLPDAELSLLATNVVGTSTVVARRAAIEELGGFGRLASAEDWDLWLRLAARWPVGFSPAITANYLMRPGSETAKGWRRLAAMRQILARYERRSDEATRRALKLARSRLATAEAELARAEGRAWGAIRSGAAALAGQPTRRAWRSLAADCLRIVTPPRTGE
jgi:glycosyltransferase involved in cell wall biosynthesis